MTKFTNTIMYNTGCEYFFDLRKARYVSQKKEAIGKRILQEELPGHNRTCAIHFVPKKIKVEGSF
jgi:hypothetical protein